MREVLMVHKTEEFAVCVAWRNVLNGHNTIDHMTWVHGWLRERSNRQLFEQIVQVGHWQQ
jgi:hypothetical protein